MKKKLFNLIPALLIGASSFAFASDDGSKQTLMNERNQQVYEVAQKDLSAFLENIPAGFEKQHGFNSRAEFAKAKPGSIYHIYGVDINGKVFTTDSYTIPVVVDNEYRAMITVSLVDGKYQVENVGAALLAQELQALEAEKQPAGNLEKVMLNIYAKKSGLVVYKDVNASIEDADLTPLVSAKTSLSNASARSLKTTYKLAEVIETLK